MQRLSYVVEIERKIYNFRKKICLYTYLIFKLLLYCVARSSLPYSSSQIRSPLLVWNERVEEQCMKGKQILLCERLLNELNIVWNIIIFMKQDLPDTCFQMPCERHWNIARVCLYCNRRNMHGFLSSERKIHSTLEQQSKRDTQQWQRQTTSNHWFDGPWNFLGNPLE